MCQRLGPQEVLRRGGRTSSGVWGGVQERYTGHRGYVQQRIMGSQPSLSSSLVL